MGLVRPSVSEGGFTMVRNIELSELSFPFDIQMTGNLGV